VSAVANGVRPVVDLNDILGDRVRERDVILGDRTYVFRPMNLTMAKLLDEGNIEAAFRALIVGDDADVDAFMEACPAADLAQTLVAIYGTTALGKVAPRSPGSAPRKVASKPSKRTSSRATRR
jgi:hypothetical protein